MPFLFFLIWLISHCLGDFVSVSNPEGNFKISKLQELEDLFLLAAGTGFTPMVKIMNYALTYLPSLRYEILSIIILPCEALICIRLSKLIVYQTLTHIFSLLSPLFPSPSYFINLFLLYPFVILLTLQNFHFGLL